MRVLYLNPIAQMGGAETSLLELLACIRAAEPDWTLALLLGEDGPLASKAARLGVTVRVIPIPEALAKFGDSGRRNRKALAPALVAAASYSRRLKKAIRRERPDLIHSTGFKMHLLGAWARPHGIPLIWHIHDYVNSRPMMRRLLRWHAGMCTSVIVNSQSVAADVREALGPAVAVDSTHNAVDLHRFSPLGPCLNLDFLSGLELAPERTVRVGLIATFAWWKGHRVFLEALSKLPPELPVRGYVIGGPVYRTNGSQESIEDLRAAAVRLGLAGRVGFAGHVDDTSSAIRALDIVVHASIEPEPFGMVIAEAMACGKAVILSAAGGARELFDEGIDAVSHEPGDAAGLARQILRMAQNSELRGRIGRAGRERAEISFASHRLANQVLDVYERHGARRSVRQSLSAVAS